ncbi:MAG: MarR family transcriptional regulator [Candidatus Nanohaloarchaea archaeon]
MEDIEWSDVSFVKRSEQRRKALGSLEEELMPSEIAKITGMHQSHVSRALNELREKNMVELLNPDDKHGRLYRRTGKGEKIIEKLESR